MEPLSYFIDEAAEHGLPVWKFRSDSLQFCTKLAQFTGKHPLMCTWSDRTVDSVAYW